MRDCPTIDGSSIPLIIHRIAAGDCLARQSCNYHKCHRCIFRGKPANWMPADHEVVATAPAMTGERAVPSRAVEVPRPDVAPAMAGKGKDSKSKPAAKPGAKPLAKSVAKSTPAAAASKPPMGKSQPGKKKSSQPSPA